MSETEETEKERGAVPFITVEEDGFFHVNPKAIDILKGIKGRVAVVSVAGLYRTGKSFLLNLLVGGKGKGFVVGGTVNAVTKGIWLWGDPIEMEDGTTLIFVDTEGLGSTDRGQTHDTRIFSLALLLSSQFIYNSRGVIDGNAIDDLSLVINLTKHIQTSSRSNSDGSDLHEFFPSLLWVVRDFTLQLEEAGKKITSRQYLENALKPQGGFNADATKKNQIRVLLSNFFRQRDCVTLVRPAEEESQLKNLNEQPYESLRPEFRKVFESMKKKLLKNIQPKMLYGNVLNGAMLANLAQTYTEAFNTGKAPVISSAWGRVVQTQCEDALEDAVGGYKRRMAERITEYEQGNLHPKSPEYGDGAAGESEVVNRGPRVSTLVEIEGAYSTLDEFGMPRKMKPGQEQEEEQEGEQEGGQKEEEDQPAAAPSDPVTGESLPTHISLPVDAGLLRKLHEEEAQQAKAKLLQSASQTHDLVQPYVETLHAELWSQFEMWSKKNEDASMTYCSATLRHLNQSMLSKIALEETNLIARQVFHEACGHDTKGVKMTYNQVHSMAEGCMLLEEDESATAAPDGETSAISRAELDVMLQKFGLSSDGGGDGDGDGLSFDHFKDLCRELAARENAEFGEFLRSLAACSSAGGDLGLTVLQHYKRSLDAMVQQYYSHKARGPAADAAVCNFVGGGVMEHFISWGEQASERHVTAMARVQQRAHRVAVQLADAQGRAVAAKESFEQERQALADKYAETERRAAVEREMLEKEIEHTDGELVHTKQHMELLDKLAASAKQSTVKASQAMQHLTHTQGGTGPLHSGYLEKETKGGMGFSKSWKTQYFVLAPAPHGLAFYASKDEYDRRQRQKQDLPLSGPGATAEVGAEDTILVVKCSDTESFNLKAATRGERDGWVGAIGDYISGLALAAAASN
jgi:hypothetical protein